MMTDLREELIQYLQALVDKRVADKKPVLAVNLSGCITQYKPFKEWLQNNASRGSDLKQKLLTFVYQNNDYFTYDAITGSIGNNRYLATNGQLDDKPPAVAFIKPKILLDLDVKHSMDTFDDNMLVYELIVFIYETICAKTQIISDLIDMIETKLAKHLTFFKTWIGFADEIRSKKSKTDDLDMGFNNETVLLYLVDQLKPFFYFDLFQRTLAINTAEPMDQLVECLSRSGSTLMRNQLSTLLYRFGRMSSIDLDDCLGMDYPIAYHFLVHHFQCKSLATHLAGIYPNVFDVQMDDTLELPIIDLKAQVLGEERYREFQLYYKYGNKILNLVGCVEFVTHNAAIIESQTDLPIDCHTNCHEFRPKFKVNSKFVDIYRQEVYDLGLFLHFADQLAFDVTFVPNVDHLFDPKTNSSKDLWIVSRIYDVKHTSLCFSKNAFLYEMRNGFTISSDSDTDDHSSNESSQSD